MSRYKLIAFDMDGTLLNSQKSIPDSNLRAIDKAVSLGKIVSLSTGRNMSELKASLELLKNVDYVIAVSGALVKEAHSDKIIHSSTIAPEIVNEIFKRLESYDVMIHIHSDRSIIQADKLEIMPRYHMGQYQDMFRQIAFKTDNLAKYCLTENPPVYKFNLYFKNTEERLNFENILSDLPLTTSYAEETSLELSSFGTTKGNGLIKLCEYLKIDINDAIAVGDADNDLDILRTAGLAIAMGNSNSNVLSIADVIVSDNDNGGCVEAIENHLL